MPQGTDTLDNETGIDTPTTEQEKPVTPPTYTPEQQEHFNTTVQQRLARQEKKLKDQFDKDLDAKIKALKEELTKKPEGKNKDEEDPEKAQAKQLIEAEKAQTKLAEQAAKDLKAKLDASESKNAQILKKQAVMEAIRERGFFNPSEVMLLTEHMIDQDDDGKYVVREGGVVKMNSSMEPMTLEEFFQGYAQSRPYLVNAKMVGGAGSSEANRSNKGASTIHSKADLKSAKEKSDYIDKFGLEAFEKLPLK